MGRGSGTGRGAEALRGLACARRPGSGAIWTDLSDEQLAADQQAKQLFLRVFLTTEEERRQFNDEMRARSAKASNLSDDEILENRRDALDDVSLIFERVAKHGRPNPAAEEELTRRLYLAAMAAFQMEAMARQRGLISGPHLIGTALH